MTIDHYKVKESTRKQVLLNTAIIRCNNTDHLGVHLKLNLCPSTSFLLSHVLFLLFIIILKVHSAKESEHLIQSATSQSLPPPAMPRPVTLFRTLRRRTRYEVDVKSEEFPNYTQWSNVPRDVIPSCTKATAAIAVSLAKANLWWVEYCFLSGRNRGAKILTLLSWIPPPIQDGIDKCCKIHDDCYTNSGCPSYLEYFVPYLWKCYKGQPLCGKYPWRAVPLSTYFGVWQTETPTAWLLFNGRHITRACYLSHGFSLLCHPMQLSVMESGATPTRVQPDCVSAIWSCPCAWDDTIARGRGTSARAVLGDCCRTLSWTFEDEEVA